MKFECDKKVKLDFDTGVIIMTSSDGSKALIQWDSDGEKEEWDAETFFNLGEGEMID